MKKLITAAVIAGGLMLLNSPEAAAHTEVRNMYQPPARVFYETRRSNHMPSWLKRDRNFRHWYSRTRLRHDRRLAWFQLYDIFRWERRWGRSYYRSDNYWHDYYTNRYGKPRYDRRYESRRHHRH
jgi:hypothetical protein